MQRHQQPSGWCRPVTIHHYPMVMAFCNLKETFLNHRHSVYVSRVTYIHGWLGHMSENAFRSKCPPYGTNVCYWPSKWEGRLANKTHLSNSKYGHQSQVIFYIYIWYLMKMFTFWISFSEESSFFFFFAVKLYWFGATLNKIYLILSYLGIQRQQAITLINHDFDLWCLGI